MKRGSLRPVLTPHDKLRLEYAGRKIEEAGHLCARAIDLLKEASIAGVNLKPLIEEATQLHSKIDQEGDLTWKSANPDWDTETPRPRCDLSALDDEPEEGS